MSWPAESRDAAEHLAIRQAEACVGCGVHREVWDPDLGGHPNAVTVEYEQCRVCELEEIAKEAGPPKGPDGSPRKGMHLVIREVGAPPKIARNRKRKEEQVAHD